MPVRTLWILLFAALLPWACTDYQAIEGPDGGCLSLADCNPGQDCGLLIACTDGQCEQTPSVDLPCQQGCRQDADCPAGMHCRVAPNDANECVIDGSCLDISECFDFVQDDCLGFLTCEEGVCGYTCLSEGVCRRDADCALTDRDCCCGSAPEDYLAVHVDLLEGWRNRSDCWAVDCPAVACEVPEDLFAVCENKQCVVEMGPPVSDCQRDSDCVKVPADCCSCTYGGAEAAVPAADEQTYLDDLSEFCSVVDMWCGEHDACTERAAVCRDGACQIEGQWCDCPQQIDEWDPVCASDDSGARETMPSACVAECLGLNWYYHGRCDCEMDCFRADPICGFNGETYWCGEGELECNGQQIHYPGECLPECDQCDMLGRPSVPVCGTDFSDYADMCYADCHALEYWHIGFCLPGEGALCGTIAGLLCPSADLGCAYDEPIPDAGGVCVKLGSCLEPDHCAGQGLPSDDCLGAWTCEQHTCAWQCAP